MKTLVKLLRGFLWGIVVLSGLVGAYGLIVGGLAVTGSDEVSLIIGQTSLMIGALGAFLSGMVYYFFLRD